MKTMLIIGAGDFQLPLVQRAAQRYEVALAAPEIGAAFQPYLTYSLLTDVRNQAEILRFARDLEVCGVITDQTDIAVRTVAYVAQELGLPVSATRPAACSRTNGLCGRKWRSWAFHSCPTVPSIPSGRRRNTTLSWAAR